jgi:hypothetical protein
MLNFKNVKIMVGYPVLISTHSESQDTAKVFCLSSYQLENGTTIFIGKEFITQKLYRFVGHDVIDVLINVSQNVQPLVVK